jgi:hypothetical protein
MATLRLPEPLVAGRVLPMLDAPWLARRVCRAARDCAGPPAPCRVSCIVGAAELRAAAAGACLPLDTTHLALTLARDGRADELAAAVELGAPLLAQACACAAAAGGHIPVLEWLMEARAEPLPHWVAYEAALAGRTETVQFLLQRGALVCSALAGAGRGGHLPTLRWLHDAAGGAWWDAWMCARLAAAYGHAHVLEWLLASTDWRPVWRGGAWPVPLLAAVSGF